MGAATEVRPCIVTEVTCGERAGEQWDFVAISVDEVVENCRALPKRARRTKPCVECARGVRQFPRGTNRHPDATTPGA